MKALRSLRLFLLIFTLLGVGDLSAKDNQIPYPDALDKAAVIQSAINDINKRAMVIGNGDINALDLDRSFRQL